MNHYWERLGDDDLPFCASVEESCITVSPPVALRVPHQTIKWRVDISREYLRKCFRIGIWFISHERTRTASRTRQCSRGES